MSVIFDRLPRDPGWPRVRDKLPRERRDHMIADLHALGWTLRDISNFSRADVSTATASRAVAAVTCG